MTKSPAAILKRNSKSFYWAGKMLPKNIFADTALLYSFCRTMDDAIDEHGDLEKVLHAKNSLQEHYPNISYLLKQYDIPKNLLNIFLETLITDIPPIRIKTTRELFRYAYGVAGTVGAMMCYILGNREQATIYRAIDLGIAMQLTNIARDMHEDSLNDRVYIPENHTQSSIIDLAESYYKSGMQGIYALHFSVRPAIMTAALQYRAIGQKIKANPVKAKKQRIYITTIEKAFLTAKAIYNCLFSRPIDQHIEKLHAPLDGLPCVNEA